MTHVFVVFVTQKTEYYIGCLLVLWSRKSVLIEQSTNHIEDFINLGAEISHQWCDWWCSLPNQQLEWLHRRLGTVWTACHCWKGIITSKMQMSQFVTLKFLRKFTIRWMNNASMSCNATASNSWTIVVMENTFHFKYY